MTSNSDIKVTVMVPFLNAQDTIERCVDSVMSQTLREMEVIFINDGSTDNSFERLNNALLKYPERIDSTTVLFYPTCHGLPHGNKEVFARAKGHFVIRCDADDEFATPNALQLMLNEAEKTGADMVMAPFYRVTGEKTSKVGIQKGFPDINKMRICIDNYSLWNKLMPINLLIDNNITPISEVNCWEDLVLTSRLLALRPKVATINTPIYKYYINPNVKSTSRSPRDTQLKQHIIAAKELEKWFDNHFPNGEYNEFINRLKFIAKVKFLRGKGKDVAGWKATFPEVNNKIMAISQVPLHYRLMFKMVDLLPTKLSQSIANFFDRFYR